MKSIKILAASIILAALAACGGQVQAAETTFKATDGQVFGAQGIYKYELYANGGGFVKITTVGGQESFFVDGGNLGGRILQALPQLVNVTGTNTYVDPAYAARVVCSSGTSIMALTGSGMQVTVADNCAMFTQIQAKAK